MLLSPSYNWGTEFFRCQRRVCGAVCYSGFYFWSSSCHLPHWTFFTYLLSPVWPWRPTQHPRLSLKWDCSVLAELEPCGIKEIKPQATEIKASFPMYPKLDLHGLNGREVSFQCGRAGLEPIPVVLSPSQFQELS